VVGFPQAVLAVWSAIVLTSEDNLVWYCPRKTSSSMSFVVQPGEDARRAERLIKTADRSRPPRMWLTDLLAYKQYWRQTD